MARTKAERLEARLTADESAAIEAAAHVRGLSKSAFVVQAAIADADRVLERERVTLVTHEHAEALLQWLDRPSQELAAMKPLADAAVLPHR